MPTLLARGWGGKRTQDLSASVSGSQGSPELYELAGLLELTLWPGYFLSCQEWQELKYGQPEVGMGWGMGPSHGLAGMFLTTSWIPEMWMKSLSG